MAQWVNHYGLRVPEVKDLAAMSNSTNFVAELAKLATSPQQDGTSVLGRSSGMPLLAECISPRDFYKILDESFYHSWDVQALLSALSIKAGQLVNSNNGHFVSEQAKGAVDNLKKQLTTGSK